MPDKWYIQLKKITERSEKKKITSTKYNFTEA